MVGEPEIGAVCPDGVSQRALGAAEFYFLSSIFFGSGVAFSLRSARVVHDDVVFIHLRRERLIGAFNLANGLFLAFFEHLQGVVLVSQRLQERRGLCPFLAQRSAFDVRSL